MPASSSEGFLEGLIRKKRAELAKSLGPAGGLAQHWQSSPKKERRHPLVSFKEALRRARGMAIIAEFKRRSPSAGVMRADASPSELARVYESSGADAISVLTEGEHFGGSLADLEEVKSVVGVPVLRKDFIFDESQIFESFYSGADAVLLIVRAVELADLRRFLLRCAELGMDALVEVHSEEDLTAALSAGAEVVGINNRDLSTLEVDLGVTERLAPLIPDGILKVSESGICSPDHLRALKQLGIDAVLVGERFMRAFDVAAEVSEFRRLATLDVGQGLRDN